MMDPAGKAGEAGGGSAGGRSGTGVAEVVGFGSIEQHREVILDRVINIVVNGGGGGGVKSKRCTG